MTNTELTSIRETLGLTKADFAKILGITPMLVGRYEKGSCVIPEDVSERIEALTKKVEEKPKKRGRKKKEAALTVVDAAPAVEEKIEKKEEKPKKRTGKKASASPSVIIESMMGGQISTEEILSRLPAGAKAVYIKVEENKAYFTSTDGEGGSVDLWS